ncbi:hypothetical protein HMPREF9554_00656 [Treponema phagedenis F0421]|nr:hypothetical protein HMPREF9554_00656 [Treponema phagedenis F0421]
MNKWRLPLCSNRSFQTRITFCKSVQSFKTRRFGFATDGKNSEQCKTMFKSINTKLTKL